MRKILELACRCPKCGTWNARYGDVNKLSNALLKCKRCGKATRIRGQFGWNIQIEVPKEYELLSDCVSRLNLKQMEAFR